MRAISWCTLHRCNEQFILCIWWGLQNDLLYVFNIKQSEPQFIFNGIDADIYDDLISRRVNISDAEKFAEVCPCPCNGVGWGVIW